MACSRPASARPTVVLPHAAPELTVIEGRVVDLRGEGVPAAKVWVTTPGDPESVLARSVADGDGFFRIAKVPKVDHGKVWAASDGFCTAFKWLRSGSPVIVKVQSAATVRGVLKDKAGKPVANATVCASVAGRVLFEVKAITNTDSEGRYELAGVPLGPTHVCAWLGGEGLAMATVQVGKDMEVALQPSGEPTTKLTVQIEGVPVEALPDITLSLRPSANSALGALPPPFERPIFRTAKLVLESLPDWEYVVAPRSPNWVFEPREQRTKPNGGPHVLKFTGVARNDATLACPVVVTGPDGKPVAGVTFLVRASKSGLELRCTSDADGKLTMSIPLGAGAEAYLYSDDDRWVSDQVKVPKANRPFDPNSLRVHEFVVDPTKSIAVHLAPASSVHGRLLRADGRPAAFVEVSLEVGNQDRTPTWRAFGEATTDRDGRFRSTPLHHIDAPVRVHCESELGGWTSQPFDLTKPGTVVKLGEAKLSEPATIGGVVRDAQKQPVGGARVWLRDWDMVSGQQRSRSLVETITDAQGRYRFPGVPIGGALLQLFHGPGNTFSNYEAVEPFAVEVGKSYTFDLELPAAK